jgi:hypothetical protein
MTRAVLAGFVFLCAASEMTSAHRLDEYLQATRVAFAGDRVEVEVDLIPGAALASGVMSRIDHDGDNTASPIEVAAYAQAVLRDLTVTVDLHPVAMTLARVEAASLDEIRAGVGAIRLSAVGVVERGGTGPHSVYVRNDHRPEISVYSVNALIPGDPDIRVLGQKRDPRQQEVRIDYSVGPRWFARLLWMVLGSAGLMTLMIVRRGPGRVVSLDGAA